MKLEPGRNCSRGHAIRNEIPTRISMSDFNIRSKNSLVFDSSTSFESNTNEDPVVIYSGKDIIVNKNVVLTTAKRCKGLFIIARNNLIIDGTIRMTARGTYIETPPNLYIDFYNLMNGLNGIMLSNDSRILNSDMFKDNFPKTFSVSSGGRGGSVRIPPANGGIGSIYSGGSGAGGEGGIPEPYGGSGGKGNLHNNFKPASGGGGAGNNGGLISGGCGGSANGQNGTGGLIFLIAFNELRLNSTSIIESKGSNGGKGASNIPNSCEGRGGGGGSGGGYVNLFYGRSLIKNGLISVSGGIHSSAGSVGSYGATNGDDGKINIVNLNEGY